MRNAEALRKSHAAVIHSAATLVSVGEYYDATVLLHATLGCVLRQSEISPETCQILATRAREVGTTVELLNLVEEAVRVVYGLPGQMTVLNLDATPN